jgi:hypothetical protein
VGSSGVLSDNVLAAIINTSEEDMESSGGIRDRFLTRGRRAAASFSRIGSVDYSTMPSIPREVVRRLRPDEARLGRLSRKLDVFRGACL